MGKRQRTFEKIVMYATNIDSSLYSDRLAFLRKFSFFKEISSNCRFPVNNFSINISCCENMTTEQVTSPT